MNNDLIFSLANGLAALGWLLLVVFPFKPFTNRVLVGVVVSLLCATYAVLVYQSLQPSDFTKFSTLQGVASLMSTPGAVLVGWIHYLAFDLVAGMWAFGDAKGRNIPHYLLAICLGFTFIFGPFGFTLYWLLRRFYPKTMNENV